MTLAEIRKNFLLVKDIPSVKEFSANHYHSVVPITEDGNSYFIVLRNSTESMLYNYLQKPNDYKIKEQIFGVVVDKGYAYTTKDGVPNNMQLVLPKKWKIKDKNISRELEVVVTNIDQDNKTLLHELYKRVRSNT
jgi:hypothetical protein